MEIRLTKASDHEWEDRRQLNSLDDLAALMEEFGSAVVVTRAGTACDCQLCVTIYDDYME